jgi:CRP-like cAMP-binding protein
MPSISAVRPNVPAVELLLLRLGDGRPLRPDEITRFGRLDSDLRTHAAGTELRAQGAAPESIRLVSGGFIAEARVMSDGRRQITCLHLPGDLLCTDLLPRPTATVALSGAQTVDASEVVSALADPSARFDHLRSAWAAARRRDEERLLDQILRLGRLSAVERMAHLLLEVHERLEKVGLASPTTFHMPLTQETIADVLGLSIVHVNRTLQLLRRDGLLVYRSGLVSLPQRERLAELAAYVRRGGGLDTRAIGPRTGRQANGAAKMTPASLLRTSA